MQQTGVKQRTIQDIIALDPEIGRILDGIRRADDTPAWHREYARVKRLLSARVGWFAGLYVHPTLVTREAYDIALAEMVRRMGGTVDT